MMRNRTIGMSRRRILKGLGAASALAPWLPILNAEGQENLFPKRLLLFYAPDGVAAIDDGGATFDWKPQGTETEFTLSAIHAPLTAVQSRIIVPYGLRFSAGGAGQEHAYGMSGLWSGATLNSPSGDANFDGGNGLRTGWGSGPSIDQYLSQLNGPEMPYALPVDAAVPETPHRTLTLGAQCMEPHSMHRMIYSGNDSPVHPQTDPAAAYDSLFAGLTSDGAAPPEVDAVRLARLDLLSRETERLRTKVGSREYDKVDAHLAGLRTLAQRLRAQGEAVAAGCVAPTGITTSPMSRFENSEAFPTEAAAMMQMVAKAFACDLTRIASIQLSRGFSGIVHSWVGAEQGHHTISHNSGDQRGILSKIDTWYAEQFAAMLTLLDSIPEGDGTVLDNTLVAWGREMGTTSHRMQPMPLILAGGARSGLRTGRFLEYRNDPHAKVLVSMLNLMGVETNSFGDRDPDSGPLQNLA